MNMGIQNALWAFYRVFGFLLCELERSPECECTCKVLQPKQNLAYKNMVLLLSVDISHGYSRKFR